MNIPINRAIKFGVQNYLLSRKPNTRQYEKIGIARLRVFYNSNKSVYFTNVARSFPDEMTTMGTAICAFLDSR
jgi:hypothetical protein